MNKAKAMKRMKRLRVKAKDFFMNLKQKRAKLSAQLAVSLMSVFALSAPAAAQQGGQGTP